MNEIAAASIAGARAFYVVTHPAEHAGDPFAALRLWNGQALDLQRHADFTQHGGLHGSGHGRILSFRG